MRPFTILSGGIIIISFLFAGCTSQMSGETSVATPINTFPLSTPISTSVTPYIPVTMNPLFTPGPVNLSISVSPEKYTPLMSSTVGIGLTPLYTGPGTVVYSWNTSYGYFISWNAPDFKVIQHADTFETTDPTIYWSYPPEDMGKEKPPVNVRLIVKTPSRTHGGNGTIAWKDLQITWENNDTAVVTPE